MKDEDDVQPNRSGRGRYPELAGRLAIVTGGASGIGLATARALRACGVEVIAVDRAFPEASNGSSEDGGLVYLQADVAATEAWTAVAAAVTGRGGRLDILVNSAGIFPLGQLDDVTEASLSRSFEVNQRAPILAAQALKPMLERSGKGSIVNINSAAGLLGHPGMIGYTSSKWGLRGAGRALARELAPAIRVNSIFPGLIDTQMARANPGDRLETILSLTPMQRIGQPSEVAAAVLFLCSDDATYITGCELTVDGGMAA